MSKPFLPDVNVWLALSLEAHPLHATAMRWFDAARPGSVHFCRYTQQGTLRLLTTAALTTPLGLRPLTNKAAIKAMKAMLDDPRIAFAEEPVGLYPAWTELASSSSASPKLWMDAYLAAYARTGGYALVTNDRGLKQLAQADVLLLK
ncbi:MAG: PIN domain-containing protein [Flavobacteriales bacterium]|nr:PIN domain-containing protein [Flavobacteriales bacterium]